MNFRLFKIFTILVSFLFLTGFTPLLSVLGPGVTVITSGNIYKATAQFIIDQSIKKKTGKNSLTLVKEELDKKKNIFVMCHTGTRSQAVCKWLKAQGYNHCVNVLGGIDAWAALIDRNIRRY